MSRGEERGRRGPSAVPASIRRLLASAPAATRCEGWAPRIEAERAALLEREEPLVVTPDAPAGPHDHGLTVSDAARVSIGPDYGSLLFALVRALRPRSALELGTNVGISAAYLAAALAENGSGRLLTLDASGVRLEHARRLHEALGLDRVERRIGLFADTLPAALAKLAPVELAFIDGHHQRDATLGYFEAIRESCADGAVLVFDDIRWSDGMKEAWRAIACDPRFACTADLGRVGVGVVRRVQRHTAMRSTSGHGRSHEQPRSAQS